MSEDGVAYFKVCEEDGLTYHLDDTEDGLTSSQIWAEDGLVYHTERIEDGWTLLHNKQKTD